MGDLLWAGKPTRYVTATEVDSVMIINGDGGYGLLVAYIGGPFSVFIA